MPLDAIFPTPDIGTDPATVRDYPMYRMPTFEPLIDTLRRFKEAASA